MKEEKISKKEKKKKKKKNKEKEKKKRNKERKKVKEDDDDDDDDDDDESADSEDSDEGEVKRVSGNLQSSTKGVFENKTADALLSSREVEKEEDKDGFLAKALLSSDVTKKDTKSKTQIEREREEERVREVCASRELAGKSARDDGEPVGVGDGGASWRLKALRRAKERAVKEGRNLEEEVQNRFGSVRQLVSGIGGKAAHGRSHLHAKYERKGADGRRGGVKRIHDDDDDALIKSSLREASTHHNRAADESKNMPVSFNAFSSDGSFMDSFDEQKRHQQKEQKQNQQQEERKPSREVEGNTSAYTNTDDVRSNLPSSKNLSAAQMLRMRLAGGKKGAAKGKEEENVSLPLVTEDGRAMPGVFGKPTSLEMEHDDVNRREFKKPKQTQMYDGNRSGEKVRYYRNDDASLRDLVAQEKHGGDKLYENYDANAADNIARKKKYKESDMNVDDEYDHDIGIEMYENRRTK